MCEVPNAMSGVENPEPDNKHSKAYVVLALKADSPSSLAGLINAVCERDEVELITVDNGWYIFKRI